MTFLSAAEIILKAARRPLTASEITDAALKRGLISTGGKTPEATMSAALYSAVKENPSGPLQREFTPGAVRAVRDSVRWSWHAR